MDFRAPESPFHPVSHSSTKFSILPPARTVSPWTPVIERNAVQVCHTRKQLQMIVFVGDIPPAVAVDDTRVIYNTVEGVWVFAIPSLSLLWVKVADSLLRKSAITSSKFKIKELRRWNTASCRVNVHPYRLACGCVRGWVGVRVGI